MSRHPISTRRLVGIALILSATACNDRVAPTAVDADPETPDSPSSPPPQTFEGNAVFTDRAHGLSPDAFEIHSSATELDQGIYRVAATTGRLPEVRRDDFIVTPDASGESTVRRVLQASSEGGELVMETAPAYWHEIIRSGTYEVSMPLDGRGEATVRTPGPQGVSFSVGANSIELPPLETTFEDVDVCQWIHDLLDLLPGPHEKRICGKEVSMEVGTQVTVGAAGTLDSLRILDGRVRVTGQTDLAITVDAGGISGGRAPVFAPCDRGHYLGCLATPTGAALIDFLRRYAPSIPEASLTPVRVCIPGTSVRIRKGYWSGWTWVPAKWERCRITDIGELPTIVLPSVQAASNEIRPRVDGHMTIRLKGDGVFTIKIAVPYLAASTAYQVTNDLKAKASVGVFFLLKASLLNGGGTVRLTFDDTGRVTQTWTDVAGWDGDFELTDKSNHAELLDLTVPDSVVVRVGTPVEAKAAACIALYGCVEGNDTTDAGGSSGLADKLFGQLNVGVNAGASVSMFEELIWTRDQIDPNDPEVDNWHISVEGAYDLSLNAGITIPLTGWILPDVPRSFEKTWECCRVSMSDYWGQGRLEVTTSTTGVDLDPDGYAVLVERADTLPAVLDAGTQRIGPGWPERVFEERIDPDGTALFGTVGSLLPCIAVYSDAYLAANPVWSLSTAAARSTGLNIPTYGATSPCRWLIGRYKVTLSGVAANCEVVGGAVRDSVWLQQQRFVPARDNKKLLHFDVECGTAGAQGSIEVALPPGALLRDDPPYVTLDGVTAGVFSDSDTLLLTGLEPRAYELRLLGLDPFCVSDPVPTDVLAGQTTGVTPPVVCALPDPEPGDVTYQASMSGPGPDENGYAIVRDGQPVAHLPVEGGGLVKGLAASQPTVLMVTDIAGNCQAEALNPRVVTLDASASPVTVDFPVTCVDAKPDTLVGTVDANGWPAPTVTVRALDGTTLVVSGPKSIELARLTGSPVRVWGRTSATGIDVHGYDLRSELGDDRWLGIVLDRTDGTWLFGEEAILLVDPPAALVGESGNLVWVMGHEVSGGVQPTLYGVIRGG